MARIEHYRDPAAPTPVRVAPAVFALAIDDSGAILMVRRSDSGNWEPPGGHVDPGESPIDAVQREVLEESGIAIKVLSVAGVYSDPDHILEYPATGEVRQQFAVYFHAWALDGTPLADGVESSAAGWVPPERLYGLPMHPVVRARLQQILLDPDSAHIG